MYTFVVAVLTLFSFAVHAGSAADHDDFESLFPEQILQTFACNRATQEQIREINSGLLKIDEFLTACYAHNSNSPWCDQLVRPNPESIDIFRCTYGAEQPHRLIHPDSTTWINAFTAVQMVRELEALGIKPTLIYNWWRPEPYNANVGGSPSRHPFATSVDVRFKSKTHQNRAFEQLCRWRAEGRLRAVGYYPTTALHFGVGDHNPNTWGKNCP